MKSTPAKIPGVMIFEPAIYKDERGCFFEIFNEMRYRTYGLTLSFVQDNISKSTKGVLRGLHYQLQHPQGKLVTVLKGKIFDVIVDIRQTSPTFGQWLTLELSDENHKQLYIPPGLAHGFYALSDKVEFHYKCTDYYHPEDEHGIAWNDSDLGIPWPLSQPPLISVRDTKFTRLREINSAKLPNLK
ncbi:MAG: dTDP-4-dehydrorhamnose 3,5-epimerase [Gammaproteobacteria bacterium RIFCSPHIGHO2_12_FULL_41_20]|nr:MAG: dTDP-4-dehydrorhamnose 3,5-epimerase [Gammaproteobacteria bacterium RIFCSPHIGHO2_12_FULL_41_20]